MPNQRAKNKVYLGGFVEKDLHRTIVAMSKKEGMDKNKFGFVAELIREAIRRRGGKAPTPEKKSRGKA